MRIVGGSLGGRRFGGPSGDATRPTSDRVREAIASALEARGRVADARILDLFAGTGAFSFEMLSRGARRALLVERDRRLARSIERSAAELDLSGRVRVIDVDLLAVPRPVAAKLAGLAEGPFDLVFADPPYAEAEKVPDLLRALAAEGLFTDEALVVLEHATRSPPELGPGLASVGRYRYGDTTVQLVETSP